MLMVSHYNYTYREVESCISYILFVDTCDSDWQFSRDGLIISAFVLSATAMVVIVATLLVAVWAFKKKRKDKYEAEVGYLM